MKAFVVFLTILMALKVLVMLIKFGNDAYPAQATLKKDEAAFLLGFRLLLFIWGLVLLVR